MLTQIFSKDSPSKAVPREGELYKTLYIYDRRFEIVYGYYEDQERNNPAIDPMPIYPDFVKEPQFTKEGLPFVTKMQDICQHYRGKDSCYSECADCLFYSNGDDLIGVCACPQNRLSEGEQIDEAK